MEDRELRGYLIAAFERFAKQEALIFQQGCELRAIKTILEQIDSRTLSMLQTELAFERDKFATGYNENLAQLAEVVQKLRAG